MACYRNPLLALELSKFSFHLSFLQLDVPNFLKNFRKKGFENENFSDYSIRRESGKGYHNCNEKEAIYCADTFLQFSLLKNSLYAGIIGFSICDKDSIIISQIQDVEGRHEFLKPLKWSNALVNLTENWARKAGLLEIMILPSKRNKYYSCSPSDRRERLFLYYDVTAKKEGYKFDPDRSVYAKPLF